MGIRAGLWLCLLALPACKAHILRLLGNLPKGVVVSELLGSDTRLLTCHRGTFQLAKPMRPGPEFTPLQSLYSSSFLSCIRNAEQRFWQHAALAGTLVASVQNRARDALHHWYDLKTQRLLVMLLAD